LDAIRNIRKTSTPDQKPITDPAAGFPKELIPKYDPTSGAIFDTPVQTPQKQEPKVEPKVEAPKQQTKTEPKSENRPQRFNPNPSTLPSAGTIPGMFGTAIDQAIDPSMILGQTPGPAEIVKRGGGVQHGGNYLDPVPDIYQTAEIVDPGTGEVSFDPNYFIGRAEQQRKVDQANREARAQKQETSSTKPAAKVEVETKPVTKPEVQTTPASDFAKPKQETSTDVLTEPITQTQTEPQTKTETKTQTKTETKPKQKTETKTRTETKTKTKTRTETKTKTKTEEPKKPKVQEKEKNPTLGSTIGEPMPFGNRQYGFSSTNIGRASNPVFQTLTKHRTANAAERNRDDLEENVNVMVNDLIKKKLNEMHGNMEPSISGSRSENTAKMQEKSLSTMSTKDTRANRAKAIQRMKDAIAAIPGTPTEPTVAAKPNRTLLNFDRRQRERFFNKKS
jgi:hypothetical protein